MAVRFRIFFFDVPIYSQRLGLEILLFVRFSTTHKKKKVYVFPLLIMIGLERPSSRSLTC